MIRNYTRPQTEIFQVLENNPNPFLDRLHAVVIGPAYVSADTLAGNLIFESYESGLSLPYALTKDGETVTKSEFETLDSDSVQVIAKDVRAALQTAVNAAFEPLGADPNGRIIQYTAATSFLNLDDAAAAIAYDDGRPPTPGDIFRISDGTGIVERKVTAILGKDIAADATKASYYGALPWVLSTVVANEADLTSSNFTSTGASVGLVSGMGAPAQLYIRRSGIVGPEGSLRITVTVQCITGGTPAASTYQGTLNGVPAAVSATTSGSDTLFSVGELDFKVLGYLAWQASDRFTVVLDFFDVLDSADPDLLEAAIDVSGYDYTLSNRRVSSSLVFEATAISNDGTETTFRISDTAGLMTPTTVIAENATPTSATLSYDGGTIEVEIPALAGMTHVGQRYVYLITPPTRSTRIFDKIQFNLPIGEDAATNLVGGYLQIPYIMATFSGALAPEDALTGLTNYTVAADEVELGTLNIPVPGYPNQYDSVKPAVSTYGTVAVEWRAAQTAGTNEGLVAIDSIQDILDNFGSTALRSEMGYGLLMALNGSGGKRVYGLNTGGPAVSDFQAAFEKLESATTVYALAILTEDEEVMKLASAHAQAMSLPAVKRFRRCYVGTDSPGEYPILDTKVDGSPYLAAISSGSGGAYNLAIFEDEVDFSQLTVTKGDFLEVSGTDQRYVIEEVQSAPLDGGGETLALVLQTGPNAPIAQSAMRVIAADTPANTARFVYKRSKRIGMNTEQDRRISNIWQDGGKLGAVTIPNRFGACEIAGLRTVLLPQQGLTRTEVNFIDSAPAMYTKFRPTLLDEMAANGVWIIAQNSAESPCYVRHQLTTAVTMGSLYYEDNAGTNVDVISFAVDDVCEPLIGKRNATPRTVNEIDSLLTTLLTEATTTSLTNIDLGPQIVNFYNLAGEEGEVDVAIDPNFSDRINAAFIVEIPLPLNNIRVVVQARTIRNDGVFVAALTTTAV